MKRFVLKALRGAALRCDAGPCGAGPKGQKKKLVLKSVAVRGGASRRDALRGVEKSWLAHHDSGPSTSNPTARIVLTIRSWMQPAPVVHSR